MSKKGMATGEKQKFPERLNRIDEILAEMERSRKWLSDKTKINYRTVVRYCNNEAQPRLDKLKTIALALGVKMCDLINDIENKG